jgi:putative two-component system response regulator
MQSQLLAYARDFRRLAESGRADAERVRRLDRQLQYYARDVKKAYDGERRRATELEKAYHDTVRRLVIASRYKDQETGKHTVRVSHYARMVALHIGWKPAAAELLFDAAPMHDVGKIGVPESILLKPAPLTEAERRVVERHTVLGAELLKGSSSPLLELARQIALSHHERWDGSGYPHGLRGERIPRAARVVRIADEYDALRSSRPYKPGFSHQQTCEVILHGDGRTLPQHFAPDVLKAFRELHENFRETYACLAD